MTARTTWAALKDFAGFAALFARKWQEEALPWLSLGDSDQGVPLENGHTGRVDKIEISIDNINVDT
jgi:hypothetical protein